VRHAVRTDLHPPTRTIDGLLPVDEPAFALTVGIPTGW
jgi:hypothetical protein